MKIAIFEAEPWEKVYIEKRLSDHELLFSPDPLSESNVAQFKDVDCISIFVTSPLAQETLDKLPNLKLVTTRSTGFDHIDVPFCKTKNVIVMNVPHYGTHTVAEHTFALILGLTRKIYASIERTKLGSFDHRELTGIDLFGKTLGVVGLGDIGTSVVKIAKGFGMHVVVYSHHPDEAVARKLGVSFLELKELFAVSDVVTLHVPYIKANHHLINKKNIKKFKKGSFLINTARGALIETEALLYGLEKGILGGVGLDVLEEETIIEEERQILTQHFQERPDFKTLYYNHVLMERENVIVTPHNAFNSKEALQMILDVTIQNIIDFDNHKPQNIVQC